MSEPSSKRGREKSPHKRKAVTPTLRFSILNRDRFRCQYCGKTALEAELAIDHIIPVAAGGQTVPENLVAACIRCNSGKSDKRIIEEGRSFQEIAAAKDTLEKIRELAHMTRRIYRMRRRVDDRILFMWEFNFGRGEMETDAFCVIRSFLYQHGPNLVFRWIEIAAEKLRSCDDTTACKYICGIRRKYLEGIEAMKSGTFKDPELQCEPDEQE